MKTILSLLLIVLVYCSNSVSAAPIICNNIFTQSIFNKLAPEAVAPYSYTGFCNAVENWNSKYPSLAIFTTGQQKDELAAFLGHVLHESHSFKANREYSMCADSKIDSSTGKVYCKPASYTGGDYNDPYCSSLHTPYTNPSGCECTTISESTSMPGYIEANLLFLGRGPLQKSWNYNYKDLDELLDQVDICANPDLLAMNEEYAWYSAFSFWTSNTGSVGKTCSQAVKEDGGSFGTTIKIINGGLECPAVVGHETSVSERLNDYCVAASALGVDSLMTLDGCEGLEDQFMKCQSNICSACKVWNGKIGGGNKSDEQLLGSIDNSIDSILVKSPTSSPSTSISIQESSSSNTKPMAAAEGRPSSNSSWHRHTTIVGWIVIVVPSFFLSILV